MKRRDFLLRAGLAVAAAAAGPSTVLAAGTGLARHRSGDPNLPRAILSDRELDEVLVRARKLLGSGLNAGDGYGEVWIRDLNTFIELALSVQPSAPIRDALLTFLRFQGEDGNIVDGYIPEAKASVGYRYRRAASAPGLLAHKNTVETDQESSLLQAVARYVRTTGDIAILDATVDGRTARQRLDRSLLYLLEHRFDAQHGLIWGATTVDWGDVQPEHEWGVELDASSHRALDIYDNALFLVAIREWIGLNPGDRALKRRWDEVARGVRRSVRRHLWDPRREKFRPHVYLAGSPFPADFDEDAIWYHGGTAVAIEAGLLTRREIAASLDAMRRNVRAAGASSIGLTVYPPYPDGFFKNKGMGAWSYQNGGDWCWFGGRMVRELIRHGFVAEAYEELRPMTSRVLRHNGFFEWWTRDNQPRGSGLFRGSAGVLGTAILDLQRWARHRG